jgi:putative ABC transport system permease protein
MVKNLRRNTARTVITGSSTAVLMVILILIGAIFYSLEQLTSFSNRDFKMVVRSRWRVPSRMPPSYLPILRRGAASRPGDIEPQDCLAWQFYSGTLDPEKLTPENHVVLIAVDPAKMPTMMDDLDTLEPELVKDMIASKRGVLMPHGMLDSLNKRIGERFQLRGLGPYKGIDLELDILGRLPDGTYNVGIMNWEYLNDAIDQLPRGHGVTHVLYGKRVSQVELRVPDMAAFRGIAEQIQSCPLLTDPPVECQTPGAAIATRLGNHRDLLWAMKWLLLPAVLAALSLVVAGATGISVRERSTEIAVLKVLGFRPGQILTLVLGETMLVGGASGLLGAGLGYAVLRPLLRGNEFLFVDEFLIPMQVLWWGPALGALTALAGSVMPAWSARRIKVVDVFARVV